MSVEVDSPTAVNNAIMAAADQILAGLKGGNLFPGQPFAPPPGATSSTEINNVGQEANREDQKSETCRSPTTVHNHTNTAVASPTVAHAEYRYCVSQSSQVTCDSKEAGATTTAKAESDLNKIASESSLASSEGSHPASGGISGDISQPEIQLQGHQVKMQQGPPMFQVAFPTRAGTTTHGSGTKRTADAMEASAGESSARAPPPHQKPRFSPPTGCDWYHSGSSVVACQPETPAGAHPPALEIVHHKHPAPPESIDQAPGQAASQPILPAVPRTVAMVEADARKKQAQRGQGEASHHQPPQMHPAPRMIVLDHKTRAPQPSGSPQTQVSASHAAPMALEKQRGTPPPPAVVHHQPLPSAQKPPDLDTKMPAVQAPPLVALAPRPSDLEAHVPAAQPQLPTAPATVPPPSSNGAALPPIYPKTYLTLMYQDHQPPPGQAGAPHATLPSPPEPTTHTQPSKASYLGNSHHHIDTSSIQIDHTNHQLHTTTLTPQKLSTTPASGTTATLAAAQNHPTGTTHYHFRHHSSVSTAHQLVGTSTELGTANTTVLTKPSFPQQAPVTASHSSVEPTTTAPADYSVPVGQVPVNASGRGSPDVSPNLRNQKMQPTDCLLFAASLLQEGSSAASTMVPSLGIAAVAEPGASATATSYSNPCHAQVLLPAPAANTTTSSTHNHQPHNYPVHYHNSPTPVAETLQPAPGAKVGMHHAAPQSNQPQDLDVLCGRGGLINKHVGNIIYRKVVEHNKPFYQTVQKRHRILVSQSIVHTILKRGGRFLSEETKTVANPDGTRTTVTYWKPVATTRAVQKTSQALRERIASSENNCGVQNACKAGSECNSAVSS
ncbi:expressed unknown protein [Seminavis robusta]|uniref:DUF6824 domain-containing protein n=1 Tax=Seminavis robusta TaxID=568900 RepID=A0A9N8DAM1_9STRA|nr:expressed unknown protein [Seminavis robusta]|eukprot:Sro12_g009580.1 n/a (839) ;mRNA; r:163720-166315